MKLVRFLMKLSNERVSVELKDGSVVDGTIAGVDVSMNIHMKGVRIAPGPSKKKKDAARTDVEGDVPLLEIYTLRGSNIRMIILPDSLQLEHYLVDDAPKANKPVGEAVPTTIHRARGSKRPRQPSGAGPQAKRMTVHRRS